MWGRVDLFLVFTWFWGWIIIIRRKTWRPFFFFGLHRYFQWKQKIAPPPPLNSWAWLWERASASGAVDLGLISTGVKPMTLRDKYSTLHVSLCQYVKILIFRCSRVVKNHLFRSYCTSFYSSQLWCKYSKSPMYRLRVAYNDSYRIFHNLPRWTSARLS